MSPKNCRECLDLLDAYNDARRTHAKLANTPVALDLSPSVRLAIFERHKEEAASALIAAELHLAAYQQHMARHTLNLADLPAAHRVSVKGRLPQRGHNPGM